MSKKHFEWGIASSARTYRALLVSGNQSLDYVSILLARACTFDVVPLGLYRKRLAVPSVAAF